MNKNKFDFNKAYFRVLLSHLKHLEGKIIHQDCANALESVDRSRDALFQNLYTTTFGTFFAVITALNIERILKYNFPNNVLGILIILLIFGITILIIKIQYFRKIDKKRNKIVLDINKSKEDFDELEKRRLDIEKKILNIDN